MTTATSSHGSHPQDARFKCSLRLWFGLLLCFYALVLLMQYQSWGVYMKVGATLFSPPQIYATASSQQLDNVLSKYNLTVLDQTTKIEIPDANRSIAFLHIGKTGGSTISMHIRNGCRRAYMIPCLNRKDGWTPNETVASYRIESYYHMEDIPPERIDHFTTIVTTVRNPISRFLSAFAYGHPTNTLATELKMNMELMQKYTCFPSISYLVKAAVGHAEIPWNKAHLHKIRQEALQSARIRNMPRKSTVHEIPPINCTELAELAFGLNESWAVVNTSHPWLNHMSFDYRQYYRSMPPDKELIVIRHNYLREDWVKVNHLLSDEHNAYKNWPGIPPFQESHRNVSSGYHMKSRWKIRTSQEQSWFCELLHEEIRAYLMIVMRAINLDEDDLWDAANDVERICNDRYVVDGANSSVTNLK